MALSQEEANRIDRMNPDAQRGDLGGEVLAQQTIDSNTPRIVTFAVTADATGALAISIPYNMILIDVIVEATATNGSGTLTLRKSTTAITDAMVCAVDTTIVRAGTIDNAQSTILTTDSINVIANGAADRGRITLIGFPS